MNSARPHHRFRRLAAFSAVAALAVSACSNADDDDAAEPTSAPAPATTQPTEPSATEPASTEPTSTEPAGTEPTSTEPATTEPAAGPDLGTFESITGVPGVTDDEIQFAMLGTGPSNPLGTCLKDCFLGGVQAYFDWRNSIGGVHGRQLTISRDVDDEMGSGQVKMLELASADDVFGVFFNPLIFQGLPDAAAAGLPVYTVVQGGPEAAGLDNVYTPGLFCADCMRKVTIHQAQLIGATKVATLALGQSQASKDCGTLTKATFDHFGPALGIEHVYLNDTLQLGLPNGIAPEVTAMKDLGVDYIATCIDNNSVLMLEQELERQGIGDVTVLLPQGYADAEFLGNNADLLEGDVLGVFFRPFEGNREGTGVDTLLEWIGQSGATLNDQAIQGWLAADMAVTGILAAGPQFDRAASIAALNAITDYTADGLLPAIDWTKQHGVYDGATMATDGPPVECIATVRIEGGEFVLLGDADDPFYSYDRRSTEWVDPVPSDCAA